LQTAALDTIHMPLLRHIDLFLLVAAAAVFVAADLPMLGYAVAAGAWLLAKGLGALLERRIAASLEAGKRREAMGVTAAAGLGRVWIIALAVLLVGLSDRDAGLAAAVLSAILFTTYMLTQLITQFLGDEEAAQR
jgi:putative exporter of polyketide antibiotics